MMEAMATGVPVLGPRVMGLPKLITENVTGWLADPLLPIEFAKFMERLMVDPDASEVVLKPTRKKIETGFDMKANARTLAPIFREMIPNQA